MIDWQIIERWLPTFASIMDRRMYTPEWLAGEIWSGRARFWGNARAALVAELRSYPTGAYDLHFLIAAGALDELTGPLRHAAEQWARERGCIGAIVESRAGWAKALSGQGYSPYQLYVRKDF